MDELRILVLLLPLCVSRMHLGHRHLLPTTMAVGQIVPKVGSQATQTNEWANRQADRQSTGWYDTHTPPTRSLYCVYTVDPEYNETAAVRPSEWIHENSDKQFNLFKSLLFNVRLLNHPPTRGCGRAAHPNCITFKILWCIYYAGATRELQHLNSGGSA